MGLFSFTQEIAIDLGTANTIIIHNDKIVVDEPSVVALDKRTDRLLAVGEKARQMHGKTHENIRTIRPLRDGGDSRFLCRRTDDTRDGQDGKFQKPVVCTSLVADGSMYSLG